MQEIKGSAALKGKSAVVFGGRYLGKLRFLLIGCLFVILTVWVPGATVSAAGSPSFVPAVNYAVGTNPYSVTTGDFNADGKTDIAVANFGSGNVSIRLGAGDGTFGAAVNYAAGSLPHSVTAGDFNADGKTDLAVANSVSNNVSILLGAGDGTFAAAVNYAAGSQPFSVTTGDFNRDGKSDLAIANYGGGNVSILLGAGDGTFAAAVNYASEASPSSVTAGDYNGDGKTDLATANWTTDKVSILLGVGDGTFGAMTSYAAGGAYYVNTGDFNADGKTDIAAANTAGNAVLILLGNGSGAFAAPASYSVGTSPSSVTTGDFNADGKADLATANYGSSNDVSILTGIGDGTFGVATNIGVGTSPIPVTTGDFNGDGKTDLVAANYITGNVSILINSTSFGSSGTFDTAVNYAAGTNPFATATDDFNNDGQLDIATANDGSDNVSIRLGAGDGSFGAVTNYAAGNGPRSVITGDFNRDGKTDLAVADYAANVSILVGVGDGTFGTAVNYTVGASTHTVAAGDFNRDGKIDLVTANEGNGGGVSILLGVGDGTFAAAVNYSAGMLPLSATTGDFNRDGKTDIAVADGIGGNVSILLGVGNGTFGSAVTYTAGSYPDWVTTCDFNKDGKADLATANWSGNNVSILLGAGDGTFGAPVNYSVGNAPAMVVAGDFNQDGNPDIAAANINSNNVSIMMGVGSGVFGTAVNYPTGDGSYSVSTGDFNRDGKTDLATANWSGNNASILLNSAAPSPAKAITGFTIPGQTGSTTINESAHTVALTVPYGTDVTALIPTITITGASVSPLSGVAHDFTTPQTYTVTAADASVQDYTVTVTVAPVDPSRNYFWTWYDNAGGDNWVLMANPIFASQPLTFNLSIGGVPRDLSGYNGGVVGPGQSITPKYEGVMGGPVKVTSAIGGTAIVSQRILWPKGGNSLEEVLGTESGKLSDHFYWTWYDEQSPGFANWILVANPSATETVHAVISFINQADGAPVTQQADIAAGDKWTPTFPGKMGGPVEVKAYLAGGNWPADARNVMASQRVLTNSGTALNEVPGIPATELSNSYLWTWYDQGSPGFADWVLIANPNDTAVTYEIKIGGVVQPCDACTIPAHDKVTPTFPGITNGPVEVTSSGGNVIASQRIIAGPSFEEVPGYPRTSLVGDYHWTWYDMQSAGATDWILVANPGDTPVTYQIKIAGVVMPTSAGNPGTIAAHDKVTPTFPGNMNGPVEVISTGGNVMVSQRVLWKGFLNEVLGSVLN